MFRNTIPRRSILAAANTQWLVPHTGPSLPRRTLEAAYKASRLRKFLALTLGPTMIGGTYFLMSSYICDRFEDGYDVMFVEREVDTTMLSVDVLHMVEEWDMRAKKALNVGDIVLYTGTDAESRNVIKGQYAASGWRSGAHKYSNVGVIVRPYDPRTGEGPFMLEVSRNQEGLPDWKGIVRRDCVQVVDATKRLFGLGIVSRDGWTVMGLDEARRYGWSTAPGGSGRVGEAAVQKHEGGKQNASPHQNGNTTAAVVTHEELKEAFAEAAREDYYDPLVPHPPRPFPLYKRIAYRRIVTDGGIPASEALTQAQKNQLETSVEAFVRRYEGQPMDTLALQTLLSSLKRTPTERSAEEVRRLLLPSSSSSYSATVTAGSEGSPQSSVFAKAGEAILKGQIAFESMWAMTLASWAPKTYEKKRAAALKRLQEEYTLSRNTGVNGTTSNLEYNKDPQSRSSLLASVLPPLSSPSHSPFPSTLVSPAELVGLFFECVGFSTIVDSKGRRRYTPDGKLANSNVGSAPTAATAVVSGTGAFFGAFASWLFSMAAEDKKVAWREKRLAEREAKLNGGLADVETTRKDQPAGVYAAFPIVNHTAIANPSTFSRYRNVSLLPGHFANNMNYHVADEIELIKENERKALGVSDHLIFGLKDRESAKTEDEKAMIREMDRKTPLIRSRVDEESGEGYLEVKKSNLFAKDMAEVKKAAESARLRSALRLEERFALTQEAKVFVPKFSERWVWNKEVEVERREEAKRERAHSSPTVKK